MALVFQKVFAFFMMFVLFFTGMFKGRPENFRVTSYILESTVLSSNFDGGNLKKCTDIILFGCLYFGEDGKITEDANTAKAVEILKGCLDESQVLYMNVLGPGCNKDVATWEEQMYVQSDRHNLAFASGNLQGEILSVLEKYELDGIMFDYEYPLRFNDTEAFDGFLVSLREVLGDDYRIGCAVSAWNGDHNYAARNVVDVFEVMAYDMWDDNGYHAPYSLAKSALREMLVKGYDRRKLDLGLAFYARPTDHDAYWYDYASYADKLTKDGLYYDAATGKTFSFNTPEMIYEKTEFAITHNYGGVMIWHYGCDVKDGSDNSLFDAIRQAMTDNGGAIC